MTAPANDNMTFSSSLRKVLTRLLDAIEPPAELLPHFNAVRERLSQELQIESQEEILRDTIELLIELWHQAEQGREEWSKFLDQLTERLQEFEKAIQGAGQQNIAAHYGGQKVESALERQIGDIESQAHSSASVGQMKANIHQRVAVIRSRLEEKQGKEAERFSSLQSQLHRLTTTVREIEQESAELRRRYEQEKPEVLVDVVTGIASQLVFEQRLDQELARWKRYKTPFVIQLWRVDNLEVVKQTYGQRAADNLLQSIAKVMGVTLRETDFIARYDSRQFAVLLTETELDAAQWASDRLYRAIVNSVFHHRGTRVKTTVSCGYTAAREEDTTEILLRRAGGALDLAPSQGGGRYCAA